MTPLPSNFSTVFIRRPVVDRTAKPRTRTSAPTVGAAGTDTIRADRTTSRRSAAVSDGEPGVVPSACVDRWCTVFTGWLDSERRHH